MEDIPEDAPLTPGSLGGSQQVLVDPVFVNLPERTGNSNRHALKVAGITTLVCLLVSAQAFTAYMVFGQRQQIQSLQDTNQRLQTQMAQRARVKFPLKSLPFMGSLFDEFLRKPTPTPSVQPSAAQPGVEEELKTFMKGFELPRFNQSFLDNLRTLKQKMNETSWKSFESWLRYWSLFQMAQKTPPPQPAPPASRTMCQVQASSRLLGSFRPQCDEQGNFKPMQCWPSMEHCWCVDVNGVPIEGSRTRGLPDCDSILSPDPTDSELMID